MAEEKTEAQLEAAFVTSEMLKADRAIWQEYKKELGKTKADMEAAAASSDYIYPVATYVGAIQSLIVDGELVEARQLGEQVEMCETALETAPHIEVAQLYHALGEIRQQQRTGDCGDSYFAQTLKELGKSRKLAETSVEEYMAVLGAVGTAMSRNETMRDKKLRDLSLQAFKGIPKVKSAVESYGRVSAPVHIASEQYIPSETDLARDRDITPEPDHDVLAQAYQARDKAKHADGPRPFQPLRMPFLQSAQSELGSPMEDPASMHRYATPEISVQALRERTDEITSSDITMDSPDDNVSSNQTTNAARLVAHLQDIGHHDTDSENSDSEAD